MSYFLDPEFCQDGSQPDDGICFADPEFCADGSMAVEGFCEVPAECEFSPDASDSYAFPQLSYYSNGGGEGCTDFIPAGYCDNQQPPTPASGEPPSCQIPPGYCDGEQTSAIDGQCPGDPVAPGFCEGGASPGENGLCPDDPVSSRVL